MKKDYTVLEVLFPQVRADILRLLFTLPLRERYVRELMAMSGLRLSTVQDELRKLNALSLVANRSNGYRRFYRANYGHPLFTHLAHIVQISQRLPALRRKEVRVKRGQPRGRPKLHHLRPDNPINWHLFSKRRRT